MANPADLKYSKEHEWIKIEGDIGIIGVTNFAQEQLTDIVFVELPDKGRKVEVGKQMAVIESVKSVSDIFSPVDGEVIEINEKLKDNPETINNDPYGEGWIVKIKMENKDGLNSLMSAEDYEKSISGGHQ
jgi:glycine cleavage system H protein